MPYILFQEHFPKVAERETRMITVNPNSNLGLTAGDYSFLEMYCNEPGCDCRRVFFFIISSHRGDLEAVVAYGWESRKFYKNWLQDDDPVALADLKGPTLNLGSPQTSLAPALLELVRNVLLKDTAYMERVKRHYRMFRAKIEANEK